MNRNLSLSRPFNSILFQQLILSFLMLFTFKVKCQEFKTIGYLPHYRMSKVDDIDFSKLTHVNLAFANPDMDGNLSFDGVDVSPAIDKAHDLGVLVYLSLAGGALKDEYELAWEQLTTPENRSLFISLIIDYTFEMNFDGIDLDLEWSHVDENYSGFVLELRDSLSQYDLGFTAALPGTYRYPEITDEAMLAFDWINMMVYDLRGP